MVQLSAPLVRRIALAKLLGLTYGLVWFFALAADLPETHAALRWGVLGWFVTMGALVGLSGIWERHPMVPGLRLRWWLRGGLMGAWSGVLLLLLAYPEVEAVGAAVLGGVFAHPLWLVVETALIGALIDLAATRAAGDGTALLADGAG